jgi:hypothetical protein
MQVTLMMRLFVLVRWSAPHQWAVIRRIILKLDRAGVRYTATRWEPTGLRYLPKDTSHASPDR